ncbi:tail fiber domain-containing protein [Deinococcus sp. 6YEL10]|uniref:tail fiber domain-containing protein n=1 Tax=Deinococcus sp. 6YEL10 TaxID=2745870 RepID=UPI001E444ED0|nr:tail fiber domain-containing protein [Deinococcus sp. 6YEL10]MCD0159764.1 tail fiber domain-containing protein [Deinococcus sp. 6YEL10]
MDRIGVAPFQIVRAEDLDARFPDGTNFVPNTGSVGLQQNVENEFQLIQQSRFTKGWVEGLTPTVNGMTVTVAEGLAYDRDGRRISVIVPQTLSFSGRPSGTYYIVAYSDYYLDPASRHIYTPAVDDEEGVAAVTVHRRILASAKLVIMTAIPPESSDPSTVLAQVTVSGGSLTVSTDVRAVSQIKFGNIPALPYLRIEGGQLGGPLRLLDGQSAPAATAPEQGVLFGAGSLYARPTSLVVSVDGDTRQFLLESTQGQSRYELLAVNRQAGATFNVGANFNQPVRFAQTPSVGGTDVSLITHLHDDRYSRLGHTHTQAEVGGLTATLDTKANISNPTFQGVVKTTSDIEVGGMTLTLGAFDQVSRGDTGQSRALLKEAGGVLTINAGGDFSGGVTIGGTTLRTGAAITATGGISVTGPLTQGGVPVALSTHLHDDRYSRLGHTHVISEVGGLQAALDSKASLSGAAFTGAVTVGGVLTAQARDLTRTGAQLVLGGAGSFGSWTLDVYDDAFRILGGGAALTLTQAGTLTASGAVSVGATLAAAGVITQGGVPVALSTHLHDDRYSLLSHTHTFSEVPGLQAALDSRASTSGATFSGPLKASTFELLASSTRAGGAMQLHGGGTNPGWTVDVYDSQFRITSGGTSLKFDVNTGATFSHSVTVTGTVDGTLLRQGGVPVALSTHDHDSQYAPLAHSHTVSQVAGLQSALDARLLAGNTQTDTLRLLGGAGALSLFGGSLRSAYLQFFTDADPAVRTAFVGFGATGTRDFGIVNERTGTHVTVGDVITLSAPVSVTGDVTLAQGRRINGVDIVALQDGHTQLSAAYVSHHHDGRYAPAVHTHATAQITGLDAALAARAPLSSPAFTGNVTVAGTLAVNGFDLTLGSADQTSRGNSGASRALVKTPGSVLSLNYAGDFTGGVMVEGPQLLVRGNLKVDGNVDFMGNLTRNGQPLVTAAHTHDDRYPLKSDLTGAVGALVPKTGATMEGSLIFPVRYLNAATAGIVFSGLTDTHSIFVEEYAGAEGTRLVLLNSDNGASDYTVFRSSNAGVSRDVLEVRYTHLDSAVPLRMSGTEVISADGWIPWARITGVPAFAPTTHTHTVAQVTGLQALLDSKAQAGHSHDVTALPVAASGETSGVKLVRADDARLSNARTPTAHTHLISEISGLQDALNAAATHTHSVAQVAGLQGLLDGKAAVSHAHGLGDLPVAASGESSAVKLVRADDARLSNARTPTAHGHTIPEIAGLQAALTERPVASANGGLAYLGASGQAWQFRQEFRGGIRLGVGISNGVLWPEDAFGGSGDHAAIYLTNTESENQELVIQVGNDAPADRIRLAAVTPTGQFNDNGVTVNGAVIWNQRNLPFTVNGQTLSTALSLSFGGQLRGKNGYGDDLWLGGDGAGEDYELGLSNASRPLTVWSPAGAVTVQVQGEVRASKFRQVSRREAKTNITPYEDGALALIEQTKVVRYDYIDGSATDRIGFVADDTHRDMSGPQQDSFDAGNTIGVLLKAVQELAAEVRELRAKLAGVPS